MTDTRFRVVRQDDNNNQDCMAHYDDALEATRDKELYQELGHRQIYSVQVILETPCRYCHGRNDHP